MTQPTPTSVHPTAMPNSDELASMLFNAGLVAAELQHDYWEAWNDSRTARVNCDLLRDEVVVAAYASGLVDGKNEQQRKAQLDAFVNDSQNLARAEADLRAAESRLKEVEGLLEVARVHRAGLHDMVLLRVAELGVEVHRLLPAEAT